MKYKTENARAHTKFNSVGSIYIPKFLRDETGIEKNKEVVLVASGNRIVIEQKK